MGPWIMFLFLNVAILYSIYLALVRPEVVVGWLGARTKGRLDRQFRYRAVVRFVGAVALCTLAVLNFLFIRWT